MALGRLSTAESAPLPEGSFIGMHGSAFTSQRRAAVGVDIGSGALKIAQVAFTRQGAVLQNFAVIPLSTSNTYGAAIAPKRVGSLLRRTLRSMGVREKNVGLTVGGPSMLFRYVSTPRMPEDELHQAMRFEAADHLPMHDDQFIYDYIAAPEVAGLPEHQVPIFLAAIHRRVVESHLESAAMAGLRPNLIEPDCLAAYRAIELLCDLSKGEQRPSVLIDIGESNTRLSIVRYGLPVLTRTVENGLSHLRDAITQARGISDVEAMRLLGEFGVQANSPLSGSVEPWVTNLVDSVGSSVNYFLIQNRGDLIDRLFLFGSGALMPGLKETVHHSLASMMTSRAPSHQVTARLIDLEGMAINPRLQHDVRSVGPLLITAVGSALRMGVSS